MLQALVVPGAASAPPPPTRSKQPPSASGYRADIDGLRALAVLAVIAFHAKLPGFAGGYVGVDVFFVISGYLITSILRREMEAGTYSLARFYERRIRRILPALLVMCAVALGVAALFYIPRDFRDLTQSAGATAVFASNIYFWRKAGYFDQAVEWKPLVHAWSLGVEEQFYILWPLALGLLYPLARRKLQWWLLGLAALSLGIAAVLVTQEPRAAFYLLPARAWELLAGAALALGLSPVADRWREALGFAGIAAILGAVCAYDARTPFPGLTALLPCLGAMAVIAAGAGGSSAVSRLLGLALPAALGRMSYSLYLWHWPVLVLSQYYLLRAPTPTETAGLLLASFGLALLSYRLVETPFRQRIGIRRSVLFASAFAATALMAGIGVIGWRTDGMPGRLPPRAAALAAAASDTNPLQRICDRTAAAQVAAGGACRIGAADPLPDFVVFGDSFGDALLPGLDRAGRDTGRAGYGLTYSGCYPLVGHLQEGECGPFTDAVLAFIAARPEIRTVVVVSRWTSGLWATRFGAYAQDGLWLTDAQSAEESAAENARVVERSLRRFLTALADRRVIAVAHLPEQRVDVPRDLALRALRGLHMSVGVERTAFEERQAPVRDLFRRLKGEHPNLEILDLGAALCDPASCPAMAGESVLYADDNHMSTTGALLLSPLFARALTP